MTTSIQKWGNSQGVRLPKFILEAANFADDEEITITAENDKIIISKAEKEIDIEELFANYDGDYKPTEIDWGEPVGKEIW